MKDVTECIDANIWKATRKVLASRVLLASQIKQSIQEATIDRELMEKIIKALESEQHDYAKKNGHQDEGISCLLLAWKRCKTCASNC